MMDRSLNSWLLFANASRSDAEIVSRLVDGQIHRYDYRSFAGRAQQLMWALDHLGVERGAMVASLAWNHYRHLEAYFGVPCSGRVLHTLNARLSLDELAYIIDHAQDRVLLVDADLVPLVAELAGRIPSVKTFIVLGDEVPSGFEPDGDVVAYESLLAAEPTEYPVLDIDEREPMGLCYTSGTTGRPKGVVFTHRSTFLHALAVTSAAALAIGPGDAVLPQVPMFHANAWGVPHAATAVAAKQVFYAGALDAAAWVELLVSERVTIAAGVPTVWLAIAEALAASGTDALPDIRHLVCGGGQPPRALIVRFRDEFGVDLIQAWGMTETSPIASLAWPQEKMRDWPADQVLDRARTFAGLPVPGVEVSIRDDAGTEQPFDGASMGVLHVRGPWIADEYVDGEGADKFTDGWFDTGDIAIGSPDGYFVIADRAKDLIKSGGEWISSVDMEAALMALPEVAEAAVVAVRDPKWQERPLACLVLRPGAAISVGEVASHLEEHGFARWQVPNRIEELEEIPRTSVGKFDKKALRARFDP